MTLEECFKKAGSKLPFIAKSKYEHRVVFEYQLSNDTLAGVTVRETSYIGDLSERGWELMEPEKPRVFRWELRWDLVPFTHDIWKESEYFLTEADMKESMKIRMAREDSYRKSRLHELGIYPKEGFVDE